MITMAGMPCKKKKEEEKKKGKADLRYIAQPVEC